MSDTQTTTLAVDLGGTMCRVGVVGANGTIRAQTQAPTPRDGDPQALAALLRQLARDAAQVTPVTTPRAGVALPGVRNRETGHMLRAVHLSRLEGLDVRALFADALGRPVVLENDVVAAGWGQWRHLTDPRHASVTRDGSDVRHALDPPRRFLYLSIGTGVGGCVVLDGQLLQHTRGGAGQMGFLIVDTRPDAPLGLDRVRGSLAACLTGERVQAAGDAPAHSPARAAAARALAVGIHQLAHLYAPEVVALGGGVCERQSWLVDAARGALPALGPGLIAADMHIVAAPLGTDVAGLIGIADLARAAH
jgi:glucokinase